MTRLPTAAGYLARQLRAAPAAAIVLAVLVAVAAFAAVAAPRALSLVHSETLKDEVAAVSGDLDLGSRPVRGWAERGAGGTGDLPADAADAWGRLDDRLREAREEMPSPLRDVFGEPLILASALPVAAAVPGATGGAETRIAATADPRMTEHLTLVDGAWPSAFGDDLPSADRPLEIVIAEDVAMAMDWRVGEERVAPFAGDPQPVRLAGVAAASDPDDGFWTHARTALRPEVIDDGNRLRYTALAFVDPASWWNFESSLLPVTTELWFPLQAGRLSAEQSDTLAAQLRSYAARGLELGDAGADRIGVPGPDRIAVASFGSDLLGVLDRTTNAARAVDATVAAVAAGPAGAIACVLVLAARVVTARRSAGRALAAARGASPAQLRGAALVEGLLLGPPPAALGAAVGIAAVPGGVTGATGWLLAAAAALAPVAALVQAVHTDVARSSATGPSPVARRIRWIGEVAVAGLAACGVLLLWQRGLTTSGGVDPLLAAVPLLLALTAGVVVLRLYPLPLAAMVRRLHRRRGLIAFLGAARALRAPSAAVVAVLAVVVGVSVAVFASVAFATVRDGVDRTAAAQTGSDARISGSPLVSERVDAIADVPGVAAIAPVYSDDPVPLHLDGRTTRVSLFVVDSAELRRVQRDTGASVPLPAGLDERADEVPAVVSPGVAAELRKADDVRLDDDRIAPVAVGPQRTALGSSEMWIVIDRANAEGLVRTLVPQTVLLRAGDGERIDMTALRRAAPDSSVLTRDSARAALEQRPATGGLLTAIAVTVAAAMVLMAVAILLTTIAHAGARRAIASVLTTLGLPARGRRALVAWETGPPVAAALVGGLAAGIVLPLATLPVIDLRAFTGGTAQPGIVVDAVALVAIVVVTVAVAASAAAVAAAGAVRRRAAGRGGEGEG